MDGLNVRELVFEKTNQRPHWPCKIITLDIAERKCQVFLYGEHLPEHTKVENIAKLSESTRQQYGKERRRDSSFRDVSLQA